MADDKFLRALANANDPVLGTSEVAEVLGYSTNAGVQRRLEDLEDEGLAHSKRIGNSFAWWISESGEDYLASGLDASELDKPD